MILEGGSVTMTNSVVADNSADLAASEPDSVAANNGAVAVAGAIHVEGGVTAATFSGTRIIGNSARMTNTLGEATAFSGGLHTDGVFTLNDDVISDNRVDSTALGSSGDAEGDSAAGEMAGTISNTRMIGNRVSVDSRAGTASASAGASIFVGTLTNSSISDNHIFASSQHGTVVLEGGGLQSAGPVTLQNVAVTRNTAHADGPTGIAQGGGIFAVDQSASGGPPGGLLALTDSQVTGNRLSAGPGVTLQGGGIFATEPVSLTHSLVAGNSPDQCNGC
jgi:hypothetical protein